MHKHVYKRVRFLRAAAWAAALAGLLSLGLPADPALAADAGTSAHQQATQTTATASAGLTQAQASLQARRTGQAVAVTAATTDSSTLTANPDGTYTLAQNTSPVR